MDQEKLNKILEKHQLWLEDKEGGDRADLSKADLDYSCWPLWCGTLDVKLCDKLQAQLLFHAFKVSKIKPTEEQKEFIKKNFHRYEECGGL